MILGSTLTVMYLFFCLAWAQLAVGKPACWWLLPRLTESAVEKSTARVRRRWLIQNRKPRTALVLFLVRAPRFFDCVGFLVRPFT